MLFLHMLSCQDNPNGCVCFKWIYIMYCFIYYHSSAFLMAWLSVKDCTYLERLWNFSRRNRKLFLSATSLPWHHKDEVENFLPQNLKIATQVLLFLRLCIFLIPYLMTSKKLHFHYNYPVTHNLILRIGIRVGRMDWQVLIIDVFLSFLGSSMRSRYLQLLLSFFMHQAHSSIFQKDGKLPKWVIGLY